MTLILTEQHEEQLNPLAFTEATHLSLPELRRFWTAINGRGSKPKEISEGVFTSAAEYLLTPACSAGDDDHWYFALIRDGGFVLPKGMEHPWLYVDMQSIKRHSFSPKDACETGYLRVIGHLGEPRTGDVLLMWHDHNCATDADCQCGDQADKWLRGVKVI